jgi:hypothetical protein
MDEYRTNDIGLAVPEVFDEARDDGEVFGEAGVQGCDLYAAGLQEGGDLAEGSDRDDLDIPMVCGEAGGEIGEHEGAAAAVKIGDEEGEERHRGMI